MNAMGEACSALGKNGNKNINFGCKTPRQQIILDIDGCWKDNITADLRKSRPKYLNSRLRSVLGYSPWTDFAELADQLHGIHDMVNMFMNL
jgi:hypothetical protein